ncbi:MAG: AMP-binding protein [Myxococcales bacterium]|nr:AMP-binding protein [Myxococcales bacterium]
MTDIYPVDAETKARALIDAAGYDKMYAQSVDDNAAFWAEQAQRIDWIKPFTKCKDVSFARDDLHVRWFYDGTLNVCYNCVDRHLDAKGDDVAIIWEGDDPSRDLKITYRDLHERVCRFANSLKSLGAKKGDRITIYMPMIPDAAIAMLACARIGAIHSVVFGGFSPAALAGRIHDCESSIVITADEGVRGGKLIPLKANVDAAAEHPEVTTLEKVLVVRNTGNDINWVNDRDAWLHELVADAGADCPCEEMGAEDPLFILYTSGSTGTPKGVPITHRNLVHSTDARFKYYPDSVTGFVLLSSFAFDSSVAGLFWTLCQGGTLTLPELGEI